MKKMDTTIFTRILTVCFAFAFCVSNGVGAENFPYTAYVAQNEATVYSSPEKSGYATQKLKAGDVVEVYQENSNGWCAIRPPVGSFSWISGAYVDVGVDHVGTITAEVLSSRIGSQYSDICKTIQVQLPKGEKVHLLGRVDTPENAASPFWYKITPPSGEFRWIHKSFLSPNTVGLKNGQQKSTQLNQGVKLIPPRQSTARNGSSQPQPHIVQTTFEQEIAENGSTIEFPNGFPSQPLPQPQSHPHPQPLPTPQRMQGRTANERVIVNPGIAPQGVQQDGVNQSSYASARNPAQGSSMQSSSMQGSVLREPSVAYRNQVAPAGRSMRETMEPTTITDPYQKEFQQINREAHIVLNRPTDDWSFETLLQKTNLLIEQAPTEYDRTRASQLYQTLEQARSIRKTNAIQREYISNFSGGKMTQSVLRNRNSTPSAASPTGPANVPLSNGAANTARTAQVAQATQAHAASQASPNVYAPTANRIGRTSEHSSYKAQGRLGWFSQRPEGHPPFALVNEEGQIVSYVTPQSGVDLAPYIDKQVGVNGVGGVFITGQQRVQHIEATAVYTLR